MQDACSSSSHLAGDASAPGLVPERPHGSVLLLSSWPMFSRQVPSLPRHCLHFDGLNASFMLQATLNDPADAGYVMTCMSDPKTGSLKQPSTAVWGYAQFETALSIAQEQVPAVRFEPDIIMYLGRTSTKHPIAVR